MKLRRLGLPLWIGLFFAFAVGGALAQGDGPASPQAPNALAGTGFTYQGELQNGGSPVTDTCGFQFSLWDAAGGGTQLGGTQTVGGVSVAAGRFTVTLNGSGQFGPWAFDGSARWLAMAVRCPDTGSYTALTPRQALTPAPLAFALPGLYTQQNITSTNLIGGHLSNTVGTGVYGATIGGGGSSPSPNVVTANYGTVGGGVDNTATSDYATIGGGNGNTSGLRGTVGGGQNNIASGQGATVGGGQNNAATSNFSTVAGGNGNTASTAGFASVGGGRANIASGAGSVVAGGGWDGTTVNGNRALGDASAIGGGWGNTITTTANFATVGGGYVNTASGLYATVGGGYVNTASGGRATVSGGLGNDATGSWATVGGGWGNTASDNFAIVSGGHFNMASGSRAAIGGGESNAASDYGATVGGGISNTASYSATTISGGELNTASGQYSTVGGGDTNTASGKHSTVGGGQANTADNSYATVGGGDTNTASGIQSTVGGGYDNTAGSQYATVAGGSGNTASGLLATVAGGSGNTASGFYATVAGGSGNTASGDWSFAAGRNARALHSGAFVWSSHSTTPISSTVLDQFLVRATGGISLTTNVTGTTGCNLSAGGGTWNCTSDRNAKSNVVPVDGLAILNVLMGVPVETWNFSEQDAGIRHIGPMAQDWYAAFGLGEGDTTISAVDADGVALAAIQGLYAVVQARDAEIAALRDTNTTQAAEIAALHERVAALEQGRDSATPAGDARQLILIVVVCLLAGAAIGAGAFALGRTARAVSPPAS